MLKLLIFEETEKLLGAWTNTEEEVMHWLNLVLTGCEQAGMTVMKEEDKRWYQVALQSGEVMATYIIKEVA